MYEIIEINSGVETVLYAATDKHKVKQELAKRKDQHVRLRVDGRIYTLYEAECFMRGAKPRKPPFRPVGKKPRQRKKDMPGYIYPNSRPVERIDAEGSVIETHPSIADAANAENVAACTMRSRIQKGIANGKGERFRYAALR